MQIETINIVILFFSKKIIIFFQSNPSRNLKKNKTKIRENENRTRYNKGKNSICLKKFEKRRVLGPNNLLKDFKLVGGKCRDTPKDFVSGIYRLGIISQKWLTSTFATVP